jgi:hypothetical protein
LIQHPFENDELNNKYAPAKVIQVIEIKGIDQPSFCYIIFVRKSMVVEKTESNNLHNHTIVYRLCDGNGDGIFETRLPGAAKFPVPSWVQ